MIHVSATAEFRVFGYSEVEFERACDVVMQTLIDLEATLPIDSAAVSLDRRVRSVVVELRAAAEDFEEADRIAHSAIHRAITAAGGRVEQDGLREPFRIQHRESELQSA